MECLNVWYTFKLGQDSLGNDVDFQGSLNMVKAKPAQGKKKLQDLIQWLLQIQMMFRPLSSKVGIHLIVNFEFTLIMLEIGMKSTD